MVINTNLSGNGLLWNTRDVYRDRFYPVGGDWFS